jgi:hypothetical protein
MLRRVSSRDQAAGSSRAILEARQQDRRMLAVDWRLHGRRLRHLLGTRSRYLHASYELHFGPIPTGFFVCHHCDNPRCVRPDHFFLGKHAENAADMKAKGRCNLQRPTMRGPGNPAAKFTLDQAQAIRKRIEGGELQAAVAREFGVHYSTIRRICKWERYNAVA